MTKKQMDMAKEAAAVFAVGLAIAWGAKKFNLDHRPLILGAGLYTMGYVARSKMPSGGWPLLTG